VNDPPAASTASVHDTIPEQIIKGGTIFKYPWYWLAISVTEF